MKKAYSFRLSEDAVMAIRIRAKERHCSEAAAVESFILGSNGVTGNTVDCDAAVAGSSPALPTISGIAPRGSFTKEDLKALIAGNSNLGGGRKSLPTDGLTADLGHSLSNTPAAPFDFNDPETGEPHRVRQIGKRLMLVYLGPDGENPIRPIGDGELEQLWNKRIIK